MGLLREGKAVSVLCFLLLYQRGRAPLSACHHGLIPKFGKVLCLPSDECHHQQLKSTQQHAKCTQSSVQLYAIWNVFREADAPNNRSKQMCRIVFPDSMTHADHPNFQLTLQHYGVIVTFIRCGSVLQKVADIWPQSQPISNYNNMKCNLVTLFLMTFTINVQKL